MTAPEHPRKDPIATAVADNRPQRSVAAEAGTAYGKIVGASIVSRHTAWNTTTAYPDRPGSAGEKTAGDTYVDS